MLLSFITTRLWFLSGLRFGRSSSPIIRQWITIAEYVWVYQGCFWHSIRHDKYRLSFIMTSIWFHRGYVLGEACLPSSGSENKSLNTFEFIKAVFDTVLELDMINAFIVYHDKHLILSGLRFGRSLSAVIRHEYKLLDCLSRCFLGVVKKRSTKIKKGFLKLSQDDSGRMFAKKPQNSGIVASRKKNTLNQH